MKAKLLTGAIAAAGLMAISATANTAHAGTLDDVRAAGELKCGINTGLPGFAFTDDKGNWTGFDVAYCRALAGAVLGDPDKVKWVNLTGKNRFPALTSGEIDVLSRNTTWTFSRDVDLGFTFVGVNYYDGQGFIGRTALDAKSARELDGASVCIQTGTTTELNLADFFRINKIDYEPVPIETNEEARKAYEAERCDVYTTDASGLAATRSTFPDADAHMVFPEIISKEPLGPLVRHGDDQWADVARWTLNALINAEELGVTQENVADLAKGSDNPEINRMLGSEGSLAEMLGLSTDWAVNAIRAEGNYSEIFERYLGTNTSLGISRGLNALWKDGGILYAPPMR
ncbi:MAG: amino acid ABC transporter substrate-binding protein [Rhodospirillaceae bacterium]|jgi:general L-amino acid transport system substrate-binding protein|nr:amino acid ABC transporter substrate-binding protein [Rhodospirillaceae bacterium]MBT5944944.1 amino acid ABC transporter substrate-binding protein [Rhodospirillaceae bacterium]MBT6403608.1 amino acid ABC transporter substrate-binding protein [Rhodospirillaceae bacterium]MBT6535992.1 amino acid ABC transporter substrate-binding protein [Rhodospirillaceae bacterium]MBT7361790.1 amino acid ABC transporter substrate-binding protein [Rhodospirillaceae bacterium]